MHRIVCWAVTSSGEYFANATTLMFAENVTAAPATVTASNSRCSKQMRLVRAAGRVCDLGEISGISRVHLGHISPEPEVWAYPSEAGHARDS